MIPVNIVMVCNCCKNLLEETYTSAILLRVLNITTLLVRLAQTITKIYRNKYTVICVSKKERNLLSRQ